MTAEAKVPCARQFLEDADMHYKVSPCEALVEVRRFIDRHDSAEFASRGEVVLTCKLGGCAVSMTRDEAGMHITAPTCPY